MGLIYKPDGTLDFENQMNDLYTGTDNCWGCGQKPHFQPITCDCEHMYCIVCTCIVCSKCEEDCTCEKFTSCDNMPVTNEREHTITETGIKLPCRKCQTVTEHIETAEGEHHDQYIWCSSCLSLWEIDDFTFDELTATDVDSMYLDTNFPHSGPTKDKDEEVQAYCGECKSVQSHMIPPAVAMWVCQKCKYMNPNVNRPIPGTARRVQTIMPNSTSNYGGYMGDYGRLCEHWRSPIAIGKWKVVVSASFDKSTPASYDQTPDFGVYLATTWGASITTTPDFPTEELGMKTVYPCLFYNWTDMKAPRDARIVELVGWMKTTIESGKIIDIGCVGAHGRTGTMLALLLIDIEGLGAKEAIAAVKERHCSHAIETWEQEDYIYGWAGEPKPARPKAAARDIALGRTPEYAGRTGGHITMATGFEYQNRGTNQTAAATKNEKGERQRLKKLRRWRRLDWKEKVADEHAKCLNEGRKWAEYRRSVIEAGKDLWECLACANIESFYSTEKVEKFVEKQVELYCKDCKKYGTHGRPRGLDTSEE